MASAAHLHFARAEEIADRGFPFEADCAQAGANLRCELPALPLDLRVEIPGHGCRFLWRIERAEGPSRDLGRIEVPTGGSLVGWVSWPKRTPTVEARVRLVPLEILSAAAPATPPTSRLDLYRTIDARGRFAFDAVPEGLYELTAEVPGFPPSRRAPLRVVAGRSEVLPTPLEIEDYAALDVRIDPEAPPSGEAWRVTLLKAIPGGSLAESVASVAGRGRVHFDRLAPGDHLLRVTTGSGETRVEHPVRLVPGPNETYLEVAPILLRGRVSLGGEPLSAELRFVSRAGGTTLHSDQDGVFDGALPRTGNWVVRISSEAEGIQRSLELDLEPTIPGSPLIVDLDLPDGSIQGIAVDELGAGVPGAFVTALREDAGGAGPAFAKADDRGRFRLRGLDAGAYRVEADRGEDLVSDPVPAWASEEDGSTEVRLVLRASVLVSGSLRAPSGAVPGARVQMLPAAFPFLTQVLDWPTDATGHFEGRAPRSYFPALIRLLAPGFPLRFLAGPARPDASRDLVVELLSPDRGGRLVIEFPRETEAAGHRVLLMRQRIPIFDHEIAGWSAAHGYPRSLGRLVAAPLEPGDYEVCLGPAGALLDHYRGLVRDDVTCRDARLDAGGETVVEF